jgi:hypothetical protein
MSVAAPVDWRDYLPPGVVVPTSGLGEQFRRIGMELGAIPRPTGTTRERRRITLRLPAQTINERSLKGWGFDRRKIELQGLFMREFSKLEYLLPRPIPSIGHDQQQAPIWVHVRLRFPKHATRDVENLRTLISKSLGDALTGPFWTGRPGTPDRRRAHRKLRVGNRVYVGGWLDEDTDAHWILTMDIDDLVGSARIDVTVVWDELAT